MGKHVEKKEGGNRTMDQFQFILGILFILLCVNYLILVATDSITPLVTSITEGFSSETNDPSARTLQMY